MEENPSLDREMSLGEHLKDLKKSILIMVGFFAAAFTVCYIYAPEILAVMVHINEDYTFVQTDVTELMAQYIKISLIAALVLDSPIIVWQVHSFVSPGLTRAEDRRFLLVMVGGLLCFAVGDAFCWTVVIPFTLQFFLKLNTEVALTAAIESLIDLKNYISYLVALMLAFGCIFEMPVAAALLASLGLIKPKTMKAARSVVLVVCFVIGAVITPPDVVSQCLVALPMFALYQFSIGICSVIYDRRRKRMIAEGIDPDEDEEAREAEKKAAASGSRWAQAKAQVERNNAKKKK